MLWIKLMGSAAVLLAGGMFSLLSVKREKDRLLALEGWMELIQYIRGQIDCFLAPMDEILAKADPAVLKRCMAKRPPKDLRALLSDSETVLDEESKRLLSRFVGELGGSYREEQIKRCDFYGEALGQRREKLFAESPAKIKGRVTLALCAALGTVVLLW